MSERSDDEGSRSDISLSPSHAVKIFSEDVIECLDTCAHMMGKIQRNIVTHKVSVYPAQNVAIRDALGRCQGLFEFIDDISE